MLRNTVVVFGAVLLVAGCGARTTSKIPAGARKDGGTSQKTDGPVQRLDQKMSWNDQFRWPDGLFPKRDRQPPPQDGPQTCVAMGLACTGGGVRCCAGLSCHSLPTGTSVCSKKCIQDNPQTMLVNEDTCPNTFSDFICSRTSATSGGTICLKLCAPRLDSNECGKGLACHPRSTTYTGKVDKAACIFKGCTTARDCPVYLNKNCTVGGPASQCAGLGSGAYCAPGDGNALSGRCARAGSCDVISGLCRAHKLGNAKAKVGSPCTSDLQCGGAMRCRTTYGSAGVTVTYPNGYCVVDGCAFGGTLTARACPSGSSCSLMYWGGVCFKSCDLAKASTCRSVAADRHGDYECRAWNNLSYGSKRIAASPICEPGDAVSCSLYSTLKCSYLGLTSGNPTKMECRHRKTGAIVPTTDPNGYCLDLTASGKK